MQQEERFDEGVGNIEDNIEPIMHRQIDGSRGIFEAQVRVSNAEIDGIKLKNQRKEKDRRFEEELARAKRLEDIEKEKHFADRKNAELDLRWAEYKEMEECQELAQSLNEHKAMFKDLIAKKQALINSLQDHIRKKDEEYIREMEAMKNEIDDIVSKMRSQFHGLRDLAQEQLTIVEQDLSKQRSDLISKNQTEINERFKMLKDKESESAEARIKQERDEAIDLENTRIKQDKEFMNAKISAEIEIQNCEKCHENMKALYMLNSEKLNYNHKVLSEKTDENANISAQLKAKDNDYRDQLKQRKEDYVKDHDALNQQNKKLTRQYTAISKQYKDLHKKFEHFVITDTLRYKEIYKMNENEIQAVKQRIINCDKIIHLQQLGVVWEPFDETQVVKEEMIEGEEGFEGEDAGREGEDEKNDDEDEEGNKDDGEGHIPEAEMHAILNIMLTELDFLLDDKVTAEVGREKARPKEQMLIKLNVLRKVLAIEDDSEMTRLLMTVYQEARKKSSHWEKSRPKEGSNNSQPGNIDVDGYNPREFDNDEEEHQEGREDSFDRLGERGQEQHEADIEEIEKHYDPNALIGILSKFIEEKKNLVVLNKDDKVTEKLLKKKAKEQNLKEQRIYRAKMSKVLPNERLKMWKVLDRISSQYYRLLLDRQKDIEQTTQLHTQNDELRNLLNQYLKVNHNLLVPPTDQLNVNFLE